MLKILILKNPKWQTAAVLKIQKIAISRDDAGRGHPSQSSTSAVLHLGFLKLNILMAHFASLCQISERSVIPSQRYCNYSSEM